MAGARAVGITLKLQDKLSKGLAGVTKQAKTLSKQAKNISISWKSAGKAVALAGGAFLGTLGALIKFNDAATQSGNELLLTAEKVGMTVEELSKLKFIAAQSDVSLLQLTNAIKTVSEKAVANSSDFKRWGISLRDASGGVKSAKQLFLEGAEVVRKLGSSSQKAAAANQLFGESGVQLMPVLNMGAKGMKALERRANALGLVSSTAAAEMANAYQTEMGNASTAMGKIAGAISREFQPAFIRFFKVIQEEAGTFSNWFAPFVDVFKMGFKVLVRVVSVFSQSVVAVFGVAENIYLEFTKIINKPFELMVDGINLVIKGINLFRSEENQMSGVFNKYTETIGHANAAIAESATKHGELIVAVQKAEKALNEEDGGLKKVTKATKKLNGETGGKIKLTAEQIAAIRKKNHAIYLKSIDIANQKETAHLESRLDHQRTLDAADAKFHDLRRERKKKEMEEDLAEQQKFAGQIEQVQLSIGQGFVTAFDAAEGGQKKFAAAFSAAAGSMLHTSLSIMEKEIVGNAAVAASEAYKAHVGVGPFIGFALAGGAASIAFSMAKLLVSKLPGMKDGGFVTGGVANQDSVPRMLMPGEFVIPKKEVDRQMKNGGSQKGNVTLQLNSTLPAGKQEMTRFVRQNVVPALNDLKKMGAF